MFGLTDDVLLANGIKIINGIAGGGKSSLIDGFFNSHNEPYARFASTNRLSRDASERYNMPVKTVAAGLFTNTGSHFYVEEKDVDARNIVIDEILQTDTRAISWALNHADTHNIIITTDSHQMLSPESDEKMRNAFNNLIKKPGVIYSEVTETLRARNDETKALYNEFYNIADQPYEFTASYLLKRFNHINYEDMPYTTHDAYITHDNLTEDYLYKDKELIASPFLDLIPKGYISSKPPKDPTKYPVLSQLQAEKTHARAYMQVMNVGSAVRFQGSEVSDDQKLYYLIQPDSFISARELYTVISRMWDINSFVVVLVNTPRPFVLHTFQGLPVKTLKTLTLDLDPTDTDPRHSSARTPRQMEELLTKYDTDDIYYNREFIRNTRGAYIYCSTDHYVTQQDAHFNKSTAGSLARRDSKLNYTYMDTVYDVLNRYNIQYIRGIHKLGRHDKDGFILDVFSAHPTMMKFEKMPIDGIIKTDAPHDNMMNFYLFNGDGFTSNSIITDDLKNLLESLNLGEATYLFSTPFSVGCFPGEWLYAKAHDTQESKKDIKDIHYGYYQKPFLTLSSNKECYVRNENHIYELLIAQVFSQLLYYMLQIYYKLNGTSLIIDAVVFPCYDEDTQKAIASTLPSYIDYRIKDSHDNIVYQTYTTPPTKADKRREQQRQWCKNMTQEQRDRRNARRRELRRLKKEASNE